MMEMSGYGYICSAGESLHSIARSIYGDERYAADLSCVNPEHSGYFVFGGGELLRLPVVVVPEDPGTTMPTVAPWKEE